MEMNTMFARTVFTWLIIASLIPSSYAQNNKFVLDSQTLIFNTYLAEDETEQAYHRHADNRLAVSHG